MDGMQADLASLAELEPDGGALGGNTILRRRILSRPAGRELLRCVSSGYLSHGCSCHATIPAEVANAAWGRARAAGVEEDSFFHFAWRDDVWLGYGSADGLVRGVYCHQHNVERARRSADCHAH